ncbi:MAG: formate dehydrogenase accessory sulfurtransferase FdhD [Methanomicrobiales archaeon]|jgi:FdhD protein|nr:formate dehydrogenase accessory sulfurtransferase FdhD [Methanomicrobiales archaeon]
MNKETKRADPIDLILEEEPVSVRLNGSYLLTAMIAPHNKEEFVTGYLFTEELISSLADIESLRIEGSNVSVLTTNPFKISKRRMVLSGCGSSSSFLDEKRLQPILSSSQFQKTIIHKSVCSLPPISAALWNSEGCLFQCSDIGIHSAAVTCIGYGFIHNIDFSSCMLALSGRIATDIVKIALFCKIPLIASSSVPTRLAITIAEKMGLCIICGVNADDMTIYTDKNIAVCS